MLCTSLQIVYQRPVVQYTPLAIIPKHEAHMPKTLTFLHTSPVHIATFDKLLAEADPSIPAKHIVDESLLQDARAYGITEDLRQRIARTLKDAIADDAAVVVCTCSTIGGCAEQADHDSDRPIVRVDRAMAERAVAIGARIVVVAALASTLAPTRQLIQEVADRAGKAIAIVDVLCEDAWAHFERGDQEGYLASVASCVRRAAPAGDVVVLAQASMAGAAALCDDVRIPILSSPQLGLEAAVRAYRAAVEGSPARKRQGDGV
jgi:hypothetical protein